MSEQVRDKPGFDVACAFCSERIERTIHEPLEVLIYFKDDSTQTVFTHVDCLGSRLDPSVCFLSLKDRDECL